MADRQQTSGMPPHDAATIRQRITERRRVATMLLVYWIGLQAIWFTFLTLSGSKPAEPVGSWLPRFLTYATSPFELLACVLGMAACWPVYEVLRIAASLPLWTKLGLSVVLTAAGAMAFAVALVLLSMLWGQDVGRAGLAVWIETLRWFAPIGLWTAAALAITYNAELLAREQRLSASREEAHRAQLRALHYQLNPHFLYNTLNSISALILDGRPAEAEHMVLGLSEFLRQTLHRDPLRDVALADEMALQRLYLGIETARFVDGLDVEILLPDALSTARVPVLILQPLVENALRHGVPEPPQRMRLAITASESRGTLQIDVSDNGPGAARAASGGGIGLGNVRERLALRYGPAAALALIEHGDGVTARITIARASG